MYARLLRPLLFLLPPAVAHDVAMAGLGPVEFIAPLRSLVRHLSTVRDARLEVKRMGLTFPSPVGLAGGFDKNARRARAIAALGFGHVELGTVTAEAQEPNPSPNLFRLPADRALINRLGFPNEGAGRVVSRLEARGGKKAIGVPVGLSIGKSRSVPVDEVDRVVADYVSSFRAVEKAADFVVVNVSSPNTENLRSLQGPGLARILLQALLDERRRSRGNPALPLLLKIAPDLSDAGLEELLAVVDETKIDGVVATNTTTSRAGLRTDPVDVGRMGAGGLSGPPLRARSLAIVRRVRDRLGPGATVIGVGGVETGTDALALLGAGADLVQLYTSFIYRGPWTATMIATELRRELDRRNASSLRELAARR